VATKLLMFDGRCGAAASCSCDPSHLFEQREDRLAAEHAPSAARDGALQGLIPASAHLVPETSAIVVIVRNLHLCVDGARRSVAQSLPSAVTVDTVERTEVA
jgi:hypothetical protein